MNKQQNRERNTERTKRWLVREAASGEEIGEGD